MNAMMSVIDWTARAICLAALLLGGFSLWFRIYVDRRRDRLDEEDLKRLERDVADKLTKEIARMKAARRKREFFASDTQERQ